MISIYIDREATSPVMKTGDTWRMDFGRIDVGDKKTSIIYIRNNTLGVIEDLEIKIKTEKKGLLTSAKIDDNNLQIDEVKPIYINFEASSDARAGPVTALISISGVVTRE